MPGYIDKQTVSEIAAPIFDFFEDFCLGYSVEAPQDPRTPIVSFRDDLLTWYDREYYEPVGLSNHARMAVLAATKKLKASDRCEMIMPLKSLFDVLPPFQSDPKACAIELSVDRYLSQYSGYKNLARFELRFGGMEITRCNDRQTFIDDIHACLQIHQNLDMDEDLEPFRLTFPGRIVDKNNSLLKVTVLADTCENALLRFAACDSSIRKMIFDNRAVACLPASETSLKDPRRKISQPIRQSPAPAKEWRFI